MISNFVLRTADVGPSRTPDQFQLRGSTDGTNWTVIYRWDQNITGDGQSNPWGTVTNGSSPPNRTAVRFDGAGVDFATPAAYTQIRFELFSAVQDDGGQPPFALHPKADSFATRGSQNLKKSNTGGCASGRCGSGSQSMAAQPNPD